MKNSLCIFCQAGKHNLAEREKQSKKNQACSWKLLVKIYTRFLFHYLVKGVTRGFLIVLPAWWCWLSSSVVVSIGENSDVQENKQLKNTEVIKTPINIFELLCLNVLHF